MIILRSFTGQLGPVDRERREELAAHLVPVFWNLEPVPLPTGEYELCSGHRMTEAELDAWADEIFDLPTIDDLLSEVEAWLLLEASYA